MNEQQIFYILGSVFFGLFIIIFLSGLALISYIRHTVRKLEKISEDIGQEVLETVRKTRRFVEYVGDFTIPAMIAKVFRYRARAKRKSRRTGDDYTDAEEE